ncbi:MAG: GxxExxY protein [Planctomycetota bacterium]
MNQLTEQVIGAAIEVHRVLGPGYLESTYAKALAIELRHRGIQFEKESLVSLSYRGESVGEGRLDFLVEGKLILELKAVDHLHPIHTAQAISYLKATSHKIALLINFNVPVLKDGIKRIAH